MKATYSNVSLVPALLDALVKTFSEALPEWIVSDGVFIGTERLDQVLEVGVEDPEGARNKTSAVRATSEWVGLGNRARDQNLTVNCSSMAVDTAGDAQAARNRAYQGVAGCQAELQRDPSIGGVVVWARLGDEELFQAQGKQGAIALVEFTVAAYGRIVVNPI